MVKKKAPLLMTPEDASRLVLEHLTEDQRRRFQDGEGWSSVVQIAKMGPSLPSSGLETIRASVERVPYVSRSWIEGNGVWVEIKQVDRGPVTFPMRTTATPEQGQRTMTPEEASWLEDSLDLTPPQREAFEASVAVLRKAWLEEWPQAELEAAPTDAPRKVAVEIIVTCAEEAWPKARDAVLGALLLVDGLVLEQFRVRLVP